MAGLRMEQGRGTGFPVRVWISYRCCETLLISGDEQKAGTDRNYEKYNGESDRFCDYLGGWTGQVLEETKRQL